MDYNREIDRYFELHWEELLEDLKRLVSIRSVRGEAREGLPFGPEPARALEEALRIAAGYGFSVRNHDNYVGTVDLNDGETRLGILAHLDVVGEGAGWTVCPPYEPVVRDGKIYGRGVSDDKGPAVAALYAMRAVSELGIPVKANVRLILGTDEESGSGDIAWYFGRNPAPPMVFTPDAEFPVINTEKGWLNGAFRAEWAEDGALPRICSIDGGYRLNVVPPEAEALVQGLDAEKILHLCERTAEATGARFEAEKTPEGVRLLCHGAGAHASTPEKGINAVTALLDALLQMPFAPSEGLERLHAVYETFPHGDWSGKAAGVAAEDELTGALTLNFARFRYTLTELEGEFDSRTPMCADAAQMTAALTEVLGGRGIRYRTEKAAPPHHTPADSPLVRGLLRAYEESTGRRGECLSTGGGTYVHDIEGGVAFGAIMPGVDTNMHGPDEFMPVEELIAAAKIFTAAIADLCD